MANPRFLECGSAGREHHIGSTPAYISVYSASSESALNGLDPKYFPSWAVLCQNGKNYLGEAMAFTSAAANTRQALSRR